MPPPSMMTYLTVAPPWVAAVDSVVAMSSMFCPLTATLRYWSFAPSEPAFLAFSWIRFWLYCGAMA